MTGKVIVVPQCRAGLAPDRQLERRDEESGWHFDAAFARIAGRFGRAEPRPRAWSFLLGLQSDVDTPLLVDQSTEMTLTTMTGVDRGPPRSREQPDRQAASSPIDPVRGGRWVRDR
jgi:hypothetical protein